MRVIRNSYIEAVIGAQREQLKDTGVGSRDFGTSLSVYLRSAKLGTGAQNQHSEQ